MSYKQGEDSEGRFIKEISEATDVPVNTLLSRKRYAVPHFRKRLNDLYTELVGDRGDG
ncbi:hypothetical protein [uncultured Parabacteroides sp.]|uniref:hypothetical protein n=1 Tax=uncultured Parabacteroides sp. TaxID=512312 RepID=UPI00261AFD52|nr:hypothetical protein [uncultured Parabacteroides sp.]